MRKKQHPKILYSELTGNYYYVPSWDNLDGEGKNLFQAKRKIDITSQLIEIGLLPSDYMTKRLKDLENMNSGKVEII